MSDGVRLVMDVRVPVLKVVALLFDGSGDPVDAEVVPNRVPGSPAKPGYGVVVEYCDGIIKPEHDEFLEDACSARGLGCLDYPLAVNHTVHDIGRDRAVGTGEGDVHIAFTALTATIAAVPLAVCTPSTAIRTPGGAVGVTVIMSPASVRIRWRSGGHPALNAGHQRAGRGWPSSRWSPPAEPVSRLAVTTS